MLGGAPRNPFNYRSQVMLYWGPPHKTKDALDAVGYRATHKEPQTVRCQVSRVSGGTVAGGCLMIFLGKYKKS